MMRKSYLYLLVSLLVLLLAVSGASAGGLGGGQIDTGTKTGGDGEDPDCETDPPDPECVGDMCQASAGDMFVCSLGNGTNENATQELMLECIAEGFEDIAGQDFVADVGAGGDNSAVTIWVQGDAIPGTDPVEYEEDAPDDLCYAEDNPEVGYTGVAIDDATRDFLARFRLMTEDPDTSRSGIIRVYLNGVASVIRVSNITPSNGLTVTAEDLNDEIFDMLDARGWDVVIDGDYFVIDGGTIGSTTYTSVNEIALHINDPAMHRSELEIWPQLVVMPAESDCFVDTW
ncbi:MAG: hypothetical protein GY716_01955 [bacterium]|nr:hypothetical protein [bacterium]